MCSKSAPAVGEETFGFDAGETMEKSHARLWAEPFPNDDEFRALLEPRDKVAC